MRSADPFDIDPEFAQQRFGDWQPLQHNWIIRIWHHKPSSQQAAAQQVNSNFEYRIIGSLLSGKLFPRERR
jgi:hypothetical protein